MLKKLFPTFSKWIKKSPSLIWSIGFSIALVLPLLGLFLLNLIPEEEIIKPFDPINLYNEGFDEYSFPDVYLTDPIVEHHILTDKPQSAKESLLVQGGNFQIISRQNVKATRYWCGGPDYTSYLIYNDNYYYINPSYEWDLLYYIVNPDSYIDYIDLVNMKYDVSIPFCIVDEPLLYSHSNIIKGDKISDSCVLPEVDVKSTYEHDTFTFYIIDDYIGYPGGKISLKPLDGKLTISYQSTYSCY